MSSKRLVAGRTRPPIWRELYERFDPEEPALEAWHADREQNPAREILATLDRWPPVLQLHSRFFA